MRNLTFIFFIFFLNLVYAQDNVLLKSEILLEEPLPEKDSCIAHQSFKQIGPLNKDLYAHEIVTGYRYKASSDCSRVAVNGALYIQDGEKYKEIYDHGGIEPSSSISIYTYEHKPYLLVIVGYNDGGGIYDTKSVFVLDDVNVLHGIDISSVRNWVNLQLLKGQKVNDIYSGIDYSKKEITFSERIFNEKDHYRHPTGGTLFAKLKIVKDGSSYKLLIINKKAKKSARDLNEVGLKFYRKKQYKRAIEQFEYATTASKTYWSAWNNLASSWYKLNEYKKSIDAAWVVYTSSGASKSSMANSAYNIAKSYEAKGNLKHALKFYESAYELAPNKYRQNAISYIKKKIKH